MASYNFKSITVVPESKEFVDIVLSKTQRKTPTVIHKGYEISRIRKFYVRKVKFTQRTIHEKLSKIIEEFPKIDEIHPFYGDLINVLYDHDHYKVALGQISAVRHIVDTIGRDYVRLLKYGDSLYRCKQVKRAALGRMATVLRKLAPTLSYLERVRQHLSRLPAIDPHTRTLLICGFPNVGKSSFLNKVSRADVEVQPYAFTTKSLYVGHTYYKYLPWQVIDTPGILDHALDERNVIEMQSITALAYLQATIMYFMDLSEQCGYTIEAQVSLFKNIYPLFAGKPIVIVFNKSDLCKLSDIPAVQAALIREILNVRDEPLPYIETSTLNNDAVGALKALACDALLNQRDQEAVAPDNRSEIYWANPKPRDSRIRPAIQPEPTEQEPIITEKEWEEQLGGAGVYFPLLSKHYLLKKDEWKDDVIPHILDGMNVVDYIDEDIMQKLSEIEMEEEQRMNEQANSENSSSTFAIDPRSQVAVQTIRNKISIRKLERALERSRTTTAPKDRHIKDALERQRENIGGENKGLKRTRTQSAEIALDRERSLSAHIPTKLSRAVSGHSSRPISVGRGEGYKDIKAKIKSVKLSRTAAKAWSKDGRKGEADRSVPDLMPKHLFQGKMTIGKRRSR